MATTGTNYTAKWELNDGVLTISPISGDSGVLRSQIDWFYYAPTAGPRLIDCITLTDFEKESVNSIVFQDNIKIQAHNSYSEYTQDIFSDIKAVSGLLHEDKHGSGGFSFENLREIDVSGLNIVGVSNFSYLFGSNESINNINTIIGLDTLNTSSANNYSRMFSGCKVESLDVSNFSNMNNADLIYMFANMSYCSSITLPSTFYKTESAIIAGVPNYHFGMAENITAINRSTDIAAMSDRDFFSLLSGQGGTWERDISGTATLSFKVKAVQRDGNNVTISYSFATITAMAYVYVKESSAPSFPQSPVETISLTGSGNGEINLTLTNDSSYEIEFIISDGETNLYVFASVDSNILLFSLSDSGDIKAAGDVTDGDGNVLSSKANTTELADYVLKETPYFELDTTATTGTDYEMYTVINVLGWTSDVIV